MPHFQPLVLLAGFLLAGTMMARAQTTAAGNPASPVAPDATLQKVRDGFSFTEGPACDAQGNVYFTDQPNDTLWKLDAKNHLSVFLKPAGRANGLCFDARGNLVACADAENQLWSISPEKKITVLIRDYQRKLLNGPNDVWVVPEPAAGAGQALYFTDPLYKRNYWKRDPAMQQPGEYVYYLSADRRTLRPVITDLKKPNGIIGTPDGKTLYISDIAANQTFSYTIHPDGSLINKTLFCSMGSDGMTIDSDGNIYLTNRGVTIFSLAGERIAHIDVPQPWTGNVCFGGKDRHTLVITASKALYTLQMRTHGVTSQ